MDERGIFKGHGWRNLLPDGSSLASKSGEPWGGFQKNRENGADPHWGSAGNSGNGGFFPGGSALWGVHVCP